MTKQDQKPRVIQLWDIEKIIPYERNAKKHPEDQIAKLARAIEKFGWTQPIVVWTNGEIIAGHGRRLAALKLGLKKVPVLVRDDLSKPEADALRLADNRVTSTEYDTEMMQDEIRDLMTKLDGIDIDITDMGFDQREIDFVSADLGMISDADFVDDISAAVEQQRAENEEAIDKTDESAAPVGDALGFKRVTVMQSREIRSYMTRIEQKTGKSGAEAFLEFLKASLEEVA